MITIQDINMRLHAGLADLKRGNPEAALWFLKSAVAEAPNSSMAHTLSGLCRVLTLRPEIAIDHFRQSLIIEPDNGLARTGLIQALYLTDQDAEADFLLRQLGCTLPVWFRVRNFATKKVAVTIDDGPTVHTTPSLLALLKRHNGVANFFISGGRASTNKNIIETIVADGHGVFSHAWSHRALPTLSVDEIISEMERTENILKEYRPTPSPYWVRLPYGLGWDDPKVHDALRQWREDCRIIQWGPYMSEWTIAEQMPRMDFSVDVRIKVVMDRIRYAPAQLERGILLAHDHLIGVEGESAAVIGPRCLEHFLPFAQSIDLDLVHLSAISASQQSSYQTTSRSRVA